MNLKLLSTAILALTLAACSSNQEESATTSGFGGTNQPATTTTTGSQQAAQPIIASRSPAEALIDIGDRIFFDLDRADLSPEAQSTLRELAVWMGENPAISIALEGHADERGTREYNLALGARRASAARDYLVALGIDDRRLTTVSYGKERPEVAGSSEVSWAQNRRSVFVIK